MKKKRKKQLKQMKKKEKKLYSKMEEFRQFPAFNYLVLEIESKIKKIIEQKEGPSYNPKVSSDYQINIIVNAIPITLEEKEILLKYLQHKYGSYVDGEFGLKNIFIFPFFRIYTF